MLPKKGQKLESKLTEYFFGDVNKQLALVFGDATE